MCGGVNLLLSAYIIYISGIQRYPKFVDYVNLYYAIHKSKSDSDNDVIR